MHLLTCMHMHMIEVTRTPVQLHMLVVMLCVFLTNLYFKMFMILLYLTQVRCIIRNIVRDWAAEVAIFLFVIFF